jgi:YbbR domain-containing protein
MITKSFRWLLRNLSALLLAILLATVVWVTAVVTSDPNETNTTKPIPIESVGLGTNMLPIGDIPNFVRLTLEAPKSVWEKINNNSSSIQAWIDYSGLEGGEYTLPINVEIDTSPYKLISIEPAEVNVILEPLKTIDVPIQVIVIGEPPLGYKKDPVQVSPTNVQVTGPESAVSNVNQAKVTLDIAGASQTVISNIDIEVVDASGAPVGGISIDPQFATVTQPISLLRGFRNVAVKVVTEGQVANGYRLTNITVTPPNVTVSSADPLLVNELPGFVETEPIDLTNLTDDIEINVGLILPDGITLVREPSVLVQVGVAAIESSLIIPLPVEILGLPPDLTATISPEFVDVLVSGPIPVLESLTPASFRLVIDLTNLEPGLYQISPVLDLVPNQVQVETITPDKVNVILTTAPTPTSAVTPTPAPGSLVDATPTATPNP